MISDLDRSLGSPYFLNVANERTCFASCSLMEVAKRFYQYRDHFEVFKVL